MIRTKRFGSQNFSRSQIISILYSSIISLAVFSLLLGMQSISLARDLGRGDPYRVVRWTELALCSIVAAIVSSAFLIRRWIQRLAKFDSEEESSSASH